MPAVQTQAGATALLVEGIGLRGGRSFGFADVRGAALVDREGEFANHEVAVSATMSLFATERLAAAGGGGSSRRAWRDRAYCAAAHRRPARVGIAAMCPVRAAASSVLRIHAIEAMRVRFPDLPQVACFDTAPAPYPPPNGRGGSPLPDALYAPGRSSIRIPRTSVRNSIVEHVGAAVLGRAVIAHLGNGASMTAVAHGASVDTSMGMTRSAGS